MDPYHWSPRRIKGGPGLSGMTNLELKELLAGAELPTQGTRSELYDRIREHQLLGGPSHGLSRSPRSPDRTSRSWFETANLGVIIHWGVYSVPGYDDVASARSRKLQNGAEWYYRRLTAPLNNYAPSGSRETRAHHAEHYPGMTYFDFGPEFTAEAWDPQAWAAYFRSRGVRYVILTAKHHDGFCLWPNDRVHLKTGVPWNAGQTGPRRDLCGELAAAIRAEGLHFGLYYSLMEWDYPKSLKRIDYLETIVRPDLFDLQARYHPNIWWFDGDWTRTMAEWKIDDFLALARAEGALINDRLGKDHPTLAGDYQTHGDRYLPGGFVSPKWENVMTIGYSWGRNYEQQGPDYKSGAELAQIYTQTVERGGNLLVNFGPDAAGRLDPNEVQSFDQFATIIGKL